VNDAGRLARDPAMRAIVGRAGLDRAAASSSQMGRFETEWLATEANLAALTDLSGTWIDRVHGRKPPRTVILDMDSSESPTHGEQEGAVWNGHVWTIPAAQGFVAVWRPGRVRSCVRPVGAVRRTAGPDAIRGSAPNHFAAFG
jgi:Transposase DDE domain group 1